MAKKKESVNVTAGQLAAELLDTLKKDAQVREVAETLANALEQKNRLESDLEHFRAEKKRLEDEIEALKENFGDEDSTSDMIKLRELTVELEATTEGIGLVEKRLDGRSELVRTIDDKKSSIATVATRALKPLAARWQEEVDRKMDELHQMLTAYQETFHIVCAEQNIVPKNMLTTMALRPLLPKIRDIDRFGPFTDMHIMHSVQGISRAASQQTKGGGTPAQPNPFPHAAHMEHYAGAGLPPYKRGH